MPNTLYMYIGFQLQSGHVWGNMLIKSPDEVSPTGWGWRRESPDSAPTPVSQHLQSPGTCHSLLLVSVRSTVSLRVSVVVMISHACISVDVKGSVPIPVS